MHPKQVSIAFVVPELQFVLNERIKHSLAVCTDELLAIYMALNWVQDVRPSKALIASDCRSALASIKHKQSENREDTICCRG